MPAHDWRREPPALRPARAWRAFSTRSPTILQFAKPAASASSVQGACTPGRRVPRFRQPRVTLQPASPSAFAGLAASWKTGFVPHAQLDFSRAALETSHARRVVPAPSATALEAQSLADVDRAMVLTRRSHSADHAFRANTKHWWATPRAAGALPIRPPWRVPCLPSTVTAGRVWQQTAKPAETAGKASFAPARVKSGGARITPPHALARSCRQTACAFQDTMPLKLSASVSHANLDGTSPRWLTIHRAFSSAPQTPRVPMRPPT